MKTTPIGLAVIKAFEGCLKPVPGRPGYFTTYYCPAGVLTIGYGHTNLGGVPPKIASGDVWDKAQVDQALANDMGKFEGRVAKILAGVALNANENDSLTSFDFNTGGLDRSSIPAKIRRGDRHLVPETLDRWNKAKGQVLAGLTRRRKSEGLLFQGNAAEALRVAGVHQSAGELMAQRVDRPTVPASEVAKRAPAATGSIAVGGGSAGTGGAAKVAPKTGTVQPDKPVDTGLAWVDVALWGGIALFVVGAAFFVRKHFELDKEWA